MTEDEARAGVVDHWVRKAGDALASGRAEFAAGRLDFAANRAYYTCFYAASAVLLASGQRFVKHSGLRAAVHRDLVRGGKLSSEWGKAYDRLFQARQSADYLELYEIEHAQAAELLEIAEGFVAEMRRLLDEAS